jgi:hypothetical protein
MLHPQATGPPARATTPKSDDDGELRQEPLRRRPDRDNPSTEIIMAETTVTPLAGGARLLSVHPPHLAERVLLALDLGTSTGWAMCLPDGGIVSGTVSFKPSRYDGGGIRYVRFRAWLDGVAHDTHEIAAIHFEEVRRHVSTDSSHIYGGLLATLTAWCEQRSIAYQGVPVGTIKRFITGKGNADKAAMIDAVRARGYSPADDNEADAIAILLWALETRGGVR